ncbi:hypothetical protein J0910_03800 [Nocardiopsis sp. CNT-189]|uniref:hypothetical protein n=1 Tax=Nocardiopsis oceanisediminis TaxID=2816862 RepID=UPI003B398759
MAQGEAVAEQGTAPGAERRTGAPRRASGAALAALVWAVGYGGLRLYWALTGRPWMPPIGDDLGPFSDWPAVLLCAAAALASGVLVRPARGASGVRWAAVAAGAAAALGLVFASFLLLLDVVGLLISWAGPGLEIRADAVLSRAGCAAGAVLLAAAVLAEYRRLRAACASCGRTARSRSAPERAPGWARFAAGAVVAACAVRIAAQLAADPGLITGEGASPLAGGAGVYAFEALFLLAGTLLPLALVSGWGRVWPRRVPLLAGRRVPRPLVLVPGGFAAVGMSCYFLVGLGQMALAPGDLAASGEAMGGYEPWFFWVAVPAYVVWGLGLLAGTASYHRTARPACRSCGRG